MDYLSRQGFQTPDWMLDAELLFRIQDQGTPDRIQQLQPTALTRLLDVPRMKRLIEQEAFRGESAYPLGEMLDELRQAIWTELRNGEPIGTYRRNLQRAYFDRVGSLMEDYGAKNTDVVPFPRGQLETLRGEIRTGMVRRGPRATRLHLQDSLDRIETILNPNG
jgi:hypothetical protein